MHLMNFIGLIQYLTPAILTGSLDCQHAQIFYGKLSIVVSPCGREKEIGFLLPSVMACVEKCRRPCSMNRCSVQFQRLPGSGFTAIADRIGQRNKFIHRAKSFPDDIQNMQFLNQ